MVIVLYTCLWWSGLQSPVSDGKLRYQTTPNLSRREIFIPSFIYLLPAVVSVQPNKELKFMSATWLLPNVTLTLIDWILHKVIIEALALPAELPLLWIWGWWVGGSASRSSLQWSWGTWATPQLVNGSQWRCNYWQRKLLISTNAYEKKIN